MIMISVPILTSRKVEGTGYSGISERTEYYTIAKHLLMSAGDAMERLMTAYKVLRSNQTLSISSTKFMHEGSRRARGLHAESGKYV